ncbi:MAG: Macrolide export protein MacA [Chloroflexi bacterium ADurb.Bin325]|nr:MAG: Macrolide export protein MacA [Chloroflexi bacterium ADurb.Bin325]
MKKLGLVVLILALLAAGGWFFSQRLDPAWSVATVVRGDIAATISATGAVLAEREATLAFQSAGTIEEVAAAVGETVTAGQVLARLDATDLELAVRQAEIGVRQAQAQLAQLQDGPSASDLAAAQAALASAQEAYQQLLKGVDQDQFAAARAQVEQARVQLDQAQQAYDKVKDRPDVGMLPQSLQLQQATISYEAAEAQYRVATKGSTPAQLAQAQAQIAQAQASLDRLTQGPSQAQVAIAQAGVDQASLALEQAQRRLDNAVLTAPWDSIVTVVNVVSGTLAQPGAPAFQIADTSRFHLDVQVDEIDVAAIAPGQDATIEIDALPDRPLAGQVSRVAPASDMLATGGVAYRVRIDIGNPDAPLRAGMSATVTIIASTRKDVLLIPNRAVQIERETGRTFVERLNAGEPQKVEVRLGLRDDARVEVREGLAEGDELAIRTISTLERLQQTFGGF